MGSDGRARERVAQGKTTILPVLIDARACGALWLPTHSLEWCSRPRAQRLTKLVVARQRAHAADRRPRLSSPVKPDLLAAADVLDEAGEPRLRRPEQLDDPSRPGGCNPTPTPRPSARLPRRSRLGDDERIGKALHVHHT